MKAGVTGQKSPIGMSEEHAEVVKKHQEEVSDWRAQCPCGELVIGTLAKVREHANGHRERKDLDRAES